MKRSKLDETSKINFLRFPLFIFRNLLNMLDIHVVLHSSSAFDIIRRFPLFETQLAVQLYVTTSDDMMHNKAGAIHTKLKSPCTKKAPESIVCTFVSWVKSLTQKICFFSTILIENCKLECLPLCMRHLSAPNTTAPHYIWLIHMQMWSKFENNDNI